MSKINSSSLFHFTSYKNVLFKILQTGIRFSYNYESYGDGKGMAVPMICFCDIPLMRTWDHRLKYGFYAIGFDKKYLMSISGANLNPVQYVTSTINLWGRNLYHDTIIKQLNSGFINELDSILEKYSAEEIVENGLLNVDDDSRYPLESKYIAKLLYRNQRIFSRQYEDRIGNKIIRNYDEREWRLVPLLNENERNISIGLSQ